MRKFKCGKCETGIILLATLESKQFITCRVSRCTDCKFQYGIKGLSNLEELL